MKGKVKWFNYERMYGFITNEDGQDVFVHYPKNDLGEWLFLEEGDSVSFECIETERGLLATNVKVIK